MSRLGLRFAGGFGLVVVCLVGTPLALAEEVEGSTRRPRISTPTSG